MAKIVSSAGEMEMSLLSIKVEGRNITMKGKMGVWDAKVTVSPEEALRVVRMMLKLSLIVYIFKLPFLPLKRKNGLEKGGMR
jgi:hypothetical protein